MEQFTTSSVGAAGVDEKAGMGIFKAIGYLLVIALVIFICHKVELVELIQEKYYMERVKASDFSKIYAGTSIGDALHTWFDGTEDWICEKKRDTFYIEVTGLTEYTLTGFNEIQTFEFEVEEGKDYYTFERACNNQNDPIGTTDSEYWDNQRLEDTYKMMVKAAFGDEELRKKIRDAAGENQEL